MQRCVRTSPAWPANHAWASHVSREDGKGSMLRRLHDMPAGTVGFVASGEVDDDDFEDIVEPELRREIAERGKVSVLYVFGPELREHEGDALREEFAFAARHPTAWERIAVVSDEDWLRPALRVMSVLMPGQLRTFPVRELPAAKQWVAAGSAAGSDPPTAW